jgi:hypothetical protein
MEAISGAAMSGLVSKTVAPAKASDANLCLLSLLLILLNLFAFAILIWR